MSRKLTTGGIALVVIGGIIAIVGIGMFFSVFMSILNSGPFVSPDPFGHDTGMPNMGRGFIGVFMAGIGGMLVKVGLGLTVAGQAGNAVKWYKKNIGDENKVCSKCNSSNKSSANFCNSCGEKI